MTDNFVISFINNTWIIGKNNLTSSNPNGIKDISLLGTYLYVPSIINGHRIEEIGCYAFFRCTKRKEVVIETGIKQLNKCSFSDNTNLQLITIPASVEFLGINSIHCYNRSLALENGNLPSIEYTGKGLLTVVFLPDSQIGYLNSGCIARKERVIIYYLGRKSPKYSNDPFYKKVCKSIKIYAHYVKQFGDTKVISNYTQSTKQYLSYSAFLYIIITYIYK